MGVWEIEVRVGEYNGRKSEVYSELNCGSGSLYKYSHIPLMKCRPKVS